MIYKSRGIRTTLVEEVGTCRCEIDPGVNLSYEGEFSVGGLYRYIRIRSESLTWYRVFPDPTHHCPVGPMSFTRFFVVVEAVPFVWIEGVTADRLGGGDEESETIL